MPKAELSYHCNAAETFHHRRAQGEDAEYDAGDDGSYQFLVADTGMDCTSSRYWFMFVYAGIVIDWGVCPRGTAPGGPNEPALIENGNFTGCPRRCPSGQTRCRQPS